MVLIEKEIDVDEVRLDLDNTSEPYLLVGR